MIIVNSSSCKGASHDKSGKPCQDSCWSSNMDTLRDDNSPKIIIVSDGHGGDTYFRSDKGSKIAVEITKRRVEDFCAKFRPVSSSLIRRGIIVEDRSSIDYTEPDILCEKDFRQLFSDIVDDWNREIMLDWDNDTPTQDDFEKVGTSVSKFFSDVNVNRNKIKKAYGCTLIAAVRTDKYWFAFHLGDGNCVAIKENGECFEPIPIDSRCFQNITTSLCQEGLESFRYCYSTEHVPAMFIASDGIEDTYSNTSLLFEFYQTLSTMICEKGDESVKKYLDNNLYVISKRGERQDDISIAYWCDVDKIKEIGLIRKIYQQKLTNKETEIIALREKLRCIKEKIKESEIQVDNDMNIIKQIKMFIKDIFESHKNEGNDLRNKEEEIELEYTKKSSEYRSFCESKDKEIQCLQRKIKELEEMKSLKEKELGLISLKNQLSDLENRIRLHEKKNKDIEMQEARKNYEISQKEAEKMKHEVVLNQYKDDEKNTLKNIQESEAIIEKYRKKIESNA